MTGRRILVADSSETARKNIEALLARKGFKIFSASDAAGAIRIARSVYPDLVLLDAGLWGQSAFDVADIIETDGLSSVLLMTARQSPDFIERLKDRKLCTYLSKPIQPEELYRTIAFCLKTVELLNSYTARISQLEKALKDRNIIEKAKSELMDTFDLSEEEAFQKIRKESMDLCLPMHKTAQRILDGKKKSGR